jgi:dGTPase
MSRWATADREARQHNISKKDQRNSFEIDRDRILYSSAFHRLAGVTQIVRAGEADVFHTRQQHTIKVAQVGRRLAQRCVAEFETEAKVLGIEPEVLDAAGLAHDLGHPPFGHAGESELNTLVIQAGELDGFEGNAQTFRVLTRLGLRFEQCDGLDLTRATLAASLKYPWFRNPKDKNRSKKWGAYSSDRQAFEFARRFHPTTAQTAEAALMDWADDIAYSVHDLEEFHRCGAIPWERIDSYAGREAIVSAAISAWHDKPRNARRRMEKALERVLNLVFGFNNAVERYEGTREQRIALKNLTSMLIGRYVRAVSLDLLKGSGVSITIDEEDEVRILKQITRNYIISSPSLIAQQRGQRKIIRELFEILFDGRKNQPPSFLPGRLKYIWQASEGIKARFASDCIASLTEKEVVGLHARLTGFAGGSVLDPIVR